MAKELADANEFRQTKAQSMEKLVVIEYFATWCEACDACDSKMSELVQKYPDVVFAKLDVDKLCDIAVECGIKSMPTFIFFKGGAKLSEVVGSDTNVVETSIMELKCQ